MANENFGLGFTVVDNAVYNEVGLSGITDITAGPSVSIFVNEQPFASPAVNGHASLLFDYDVDLKNAGAAIHFSASGICARPSILGADVNPANINTLAGPGENNLSTC